MAADSQAVYRAFHSHDIPRSDFKQVGTRLKDPGPDILLYTHPFTVIISDKKSVESSRSIRIDDYGEHTSVVRFHEIYFRLV